MISFFLHLLVLARGQDVGAFAIRAFHPVPPVRQDIDQFGIAALPAFRALEFEHHRNHLPSE